MSEIWDRTASPVVWDGFNLFVGPPKHRITSTVIDLTVPDASVDLEVPDEAETLQVEGDDE